MQAAVDPKLWRNSWPAPQKPPLSDIVTSGIGQMPAGEHALPLGRSNPTEAVRSMPCTGACNPEKDPQQPHVHVNRFKSPCLSLANNGLK